MNTSCIQRYLLDNKLMALLKKQQVERLYRALAGVLADIQLKQYYLICQINWFKGIFGGRLK